jgi:glutaminyl-peptide cyclotransferase
VRSRAAFAPRACALMALVLLTAAPSCKAKSDTLDPQKIQPKPDAAAQAPRHPDGARQLTPFDGQRAFEHVRKQVAFGPRPAGSPQLAATRKYIKDELASYGLAVREQAFSAETPLGAVAMVNVIAEIPGASPGVVIIASHYDTKRTPAGFLGANDAGSSTGALLEIARVLAEQSKAQKPRFGIQLVFFDGEEAAVQWSEDDSLYGSRHFVEQLEAKGQEGAVKSMVLLDMIGDKDLMIPREENSTPELVEIIWRTAAELGYTKQFPDFRHAISDDHIPFVDAGIAAVDLIDFTYGTDKAKFGDGGPSNAYWHTTEDTLDKLSPESLKAVGDVVVASVPRIMAAVR